MSRIVELHDRKPLVINEDDVEDGAVAVCRCGLSNDWPYCDGSHNKAKDEDGRHKYTRHDGELKREDASDVDDADPRA